MPPLTTFEDTQGIACNLKEAVGNTVERILRSTCATSNQILVRVKCGFDGSGSHAVYNQKDSLCGNTSHFISCIFSVVHVSDMKSGEIFWGRKKSIVLPLLDL